MLEKSLKLSCSTPFSQFPFNKITCNIPVNITISGLPNKVLTVLLIIKNIYDRFSLVYVFINFNRSFLGKFRCFFGWFLSSKSPSAFNLQLSVILTWHVNAAKFRSENILPHVLDLLGLRTNRKQLVNFEIKITKRIFTLAAFGVRHARLNRSADANFVLLMTKSAEGPISSNSIWGVFVPLLIIIKILFTKQTRLVQRQI